MLIIELLLICVLVMLFFVVRREEDEYKYATMPQGGIEKYWSGAERRRHVRLNALLGLRYNVKKSNVASADNGTSNDVCERGMRILVDRKLKRGSILEIEITPSKAKGSIFVEAMVIWSNEAREKRASADKRFFHAGIKFLRIKKESEAAFEHLIRALEDGLRLEPGA